MNIVAWAESGEHFAERIRLSAQDLDCILVELEGVQLLDDRMQDENFPEELIDMRSTAYRQQNDIVYGHFHTWLQEDAN